MTFTEAAVEVLRLAGKPLHYKKITEIAIERSMLAHVGKTPEVTMSSRLATVVKRDRGDAPIIKVKPGVFGLRDFSTTQLSDLSGDIDELPEAEVQEEQNKAAGEVEASEAPLETPAHAERRPLPGADVFPEEADDDEPILGSAEEEDDEDEDEAGEGGEEERAEGAGDAERSSRRRRRKRRRGRGEGAEAAESGRTEGEERAERNERPERHERAERNERPERHERGDRNERHARGDRERDRGERDRERGERDRDRDRERGRNSADRGRDDFRRDRDRGRDEPDFHREPGDGDLLGKDLADAVASVLAGAGPRGQSPLRVAEQLVRRGRLNGEPQVLVPTVMAAVRADVARRGVEGGRARFRSDNGNILLSDFLLPQDVTRAEQEVLRAAERQRERTRRAFLRRLSELPVASLAELLATWLNAEGVVSLRAVRRPGTQGSDLHFAGTLRRGVEEVRVAIIFVRDGRELGRERVIEARGATYYYGNAQSVWLITLGQVMSGAREEGAAPAAVPVALLDGLALAAAMERAGVGMRTQLVPISSIDLDLFDALRGRERSERDGDRDRDRDRERDRGRGRDRDRDRERDHERRERGPREDRELLGSNVHVSRDLPDQDEELDETLDAERGESAGEEQDTANVGAPAARDSQERPLESDPEGREGGRRRRRRRRRGRDRLASDAQDLERRSTTEEAATASAGGGALESVEDADGATDEEWEEAEAAETAQPKSGRPHHYEADPSVPPARDDDERGRYAERADWDEDEEEEPESLDDDPDEADAEDRPARRYEDEPSDDED